MKFKRYSSGLTAETATRKLRSLKRSLLALMLILGVVAGSQAAELVIGRQTVSAIILELELPRVCRDKRSRIQGPKHRSGRSGFPGKYCGLVLTDHGSFALPQSARFSLFQESRESLFDGLIEGCRFQLLLAGYGPDLEEGAAFSTVTNKTLLRADVIGPCPELGTKL